MLIFYKYDMGNILAYVEPYKGRFVGGEEKNRRKELFLSTFYKTLCNISETCLKVNIERNTYYEWIKEDRKFKIQVRYANEALLDLAESNAMKLVRGIPKLNEKGEQVGWFSKPSDTMIQYVLNHKGQSRGYGKQPLIEGEERKAIDLSTLSVDERKQLYALMNKAQPKDDTEDAEIIE